MQSELSTAIVAPTCLRTLRLKVKAESYRWLNAAAIEVSQVWNYANETSARAARPYAGPAKWLSVVSRGACSPASTAMAVSALANSPRMLRKSSASIAEVMPHPMMIESKQLRILRKFTTCECTRAAMLRTVEPLGIRCSSPL